MLAKLSEFEIKAEAPFENDVLGRKDSIEVLAANAPTLGSILR